MAKSKVRDKAYYDKLLSKIKEVENLESISTDDIDDILLELTDLGFDSNISANLDTQYGNVISCLMIRKPVATLRSQSSTLVKSMDVDLDLNFFERYTSFLKEFARAVKSIYKKLSKYGHCVYSYNCSVIEEKTYEIRFLLYVNSSKYKIGNLKAENLDD